jgi:hypothetical protein
MSEDLSQLDEEYLLVWGAETSYNYFSGKESPTRFVYQYPLYHCTYADEEVIQSFREDIQMRSPAIVDTSSSNPRIPPLDPGRRGRTQLQQEECALSSQMVDLMDGIWEMYEETGRMDKTNWPIYQLKEQSLHEE